MKKAKPSRKINLKDKPYRPKIEKLPQTKDVRQVDWDFDITPDKTWSVFMQEEIMKVAQENPLNPFLPRLNANSITFYTTPNQHEKHLNRIRQAIDGANKQVDEYNRRINQLDREEFEKKDQEEKENKEMFK